ncbi:DUF6214 family protein, partial [Streptomyces sp. NPDC006265]|uniref:DUF6214 family protein n=1 Tax=Streptomyces sp. NPDC006265 TaxID=3156740 RepID=UPI0033AC68E9
MAVRPAWEVRENEGATRWFEFRLAFADGARVDALAVVGGGCVCVEEVCAQPALLPLHQCRHTPPRPVPQQP